MSTLSSHGRWPETTTPKLPREDEEGVDDDLCRLEDDDLFRLEPRLELLVVLGGGA